MKILLINPPIREWAVPNCVPLGMAYIAAILRANGHEVQVLDINGYRYSKKDVDEMVKNSDYDVAGTGGLITTAKYVKWLVEIMKKYHPDKKVILGGVVATSVPELMLNNTQADVACIGESEVTILELVNAISASNDLNRVNGICYRDGQSNIRKTPARAPIADLDDIPLPAYDLFPMDIYVNNPVGYINKNKWSTGRIDNSVIQKSANINVSRGCPYQCIFCYHDFMGVKSRHHSPEYVLREMKFLNKQYGVTYFLWADDEPIIDRKFIEDFCAVMKREKTGFQFCLAGRVNLVDRSLLENLRAAGCNMVGYGIESGSPRMLDAMKKNATVEQAKEAIKLTREVFGDVDATFVIGLPGENEETVRETGEFCKEVGLAPEAIFFATAYPGTELYAYALKKGLIIDEFDYISKLWEQGEQILVNFTEWTSEELYTIRTNMINELKAWNSERHARF